LILRFFQGAISGFVAPSLALIATSTPREKTGQALGTLQAALVTGMVLGPLMGGVFAHFMGFRSIFFWTGSLCFVGAIVAYRFVKEDFVRPDKAEGSSLSRNISYIFHSSQLRAMLGLLILVQFSIQVVSPFLSLYVESLHVSPEYVGLVTGMVFGITGVTNAVTSPLWGKQADRRGFRKILRISLLGMILFYVPQAFATGAGQLLFLRAGLGVFVAGAIPTINAIVHRSTPEKDRGGMYGIFQSGLMIGNVAGPLLGGILSAAFGLRTIFLITTGLMIIAFFWEKKAAVNVTPESIHAEKV
jgi:MFS transporter, DHA1 family, multidrug resistance protein